MASLFQVPQPSIGLMGAQRGRPRSTDPREAGILEALMAQMQSPQAQQAQAASAGPEPRRRVSVMDVLGRSLAPNTFAALDGERTRLQAEADRPAMLARQARMRQIAAQYGPMAELGLELSPAKLGEALSSNLEGYTLAAGGVRGGAGGPVMGAPTTTVVNDQIYQNDPLARTSTRIATADPAYADVTRRMEYENPTLAANATQFNRDGTIRNQGYIAPEVTNTPAGGTTNVLDAQGRVINSIQGNADTSPRKSYNDTLGVRRFEDTGEPVFPDDFARIRGHAESRVTAADQSAANLTKTINEALALSGGGETGLVGAAMGAVPGTRARRLRGVIETIKSNVGFNYLQQMRELSPTGGALGSVAQQELQSLQSVWGNLDPNASEQQLDGVLRQMLGMVGQGVALRREAFNSQYGMAPAVRSGGAQGGGSDAGGGPRLTPQEAQALPPGTPFIGTDGVQRVRR